jgi:hypothetical protein
MAGQIRKRPGKMRTRVPQPAPLAGEPSSADIAVGVTGSAPLSAGWMPNLWMLGASCGNACS